MRLSIPSYVLWSVCVCICVRVCLCLRVSICVHTFLGDTLDNPDKNWKRVSIALNLFTSLKHNSCIRYAIIITLTASTAYTTATPLVDNITKWWSLECHFCVRTFPCWDSETGKPPNRLVSKSCNLQHYCTSTFFLKVEGKTRVSCHTSVMWTFHCITICWHNCGSVL